MNRFRIRTKRIPLPPPPSEALIMIPFSYPIRRATSKACSTVRQVPFSKVSFGIVPSGVSSATRGPSSGPPNDPLHGLMNRTERVVSKQRTRRHPARASDSLLTPREARPSEPKYWLQFYHPEHSSLEKLDQ